MSDQALPGCMMAYITIGFRSIVQVSYNARLDDVDHEQSPAKTRASQFPTESIRAQNVGQKQQGW